MMRATTCASFILLAASALSTQPAPLAFEVASIKPNPAADGHSHVGQHNGTVTMTDVTLRQCVVEAYGIQDSTLIAPDWLATTHFDIQAKAPADHPDDYFQPMLKALLEERFKLSVHRETQTLPAYTLVAGRGGLKFKEAEASGGHQTKTSRSQFNGTKVTLRELADFLAQILDRPVIDRTDTKGMYDMTLQFAPVSQTMNAAAGETSSAPSVFTALQEQLGLKLQPEKVPVEVVVVDHMEKAPTEN